MASLRLDKDLLWLFQRVTGWCFRDIYQSQLSQECQAHNELIWTQQPYRQTEARLTADYDIALAIIEDPLHYVVRSYCQQYQTRIHRDLFMEHTFLTFVRARLLLWRRHVQYWQKRGPKVLLVLKQKLYFDSKSTFKRIGEHLKLDDPCIWERMMDQNRPLFERLRQKHLEILHQVQVPPHIQKVMQQLIMPQLCWFGMARLELPHCQIIMRSYMDRLDNLDDWWLPDRGTQTVNLLTTYYHSDNEQRQSELNYALEMNTMNAFIDRVHVWTASGENASLPLASRKILEIRASNQPHYLDFFEYANYFLKGEIVIVQNADIFWTDDSLRQISNLKRGTVFALSRHSNASKLPITQCEDQTIRHNQNLCINYVGSHDVFIFVPPIDPSIVRNFDFRQNTWYYRYIILLKTYIGFRGAENYIIEALRYGGMTVENPCLDLRAYHAHCSNERKNTARRISPPEEGTRINRAKGLAKPKLLSDLFG